MTTPGTLYGIGVGPGDPELLTLKAARLLGGVREVFAASSTKNDYSLAEAAAAPHLPGGVAVTRLGFPMTRDQHALDRAWEDNAARVAEALDAGRRCAFLTIGDPMTYSTFGYLLRALLRIRPDAGVEVVPGITSYQAAAAASRTVLAESGESLTIVSGVGGEERLRTLLECSDNAVVLKAYRNFGDIRRAVADMGLEESSVFVSRLGLAGETVVRGLDAAPEDPHYLSLVLVKKGGG